MTIESLKEQLATLGTECEQAKAHLYRVEGAISLITHLIQKEEEQGPSSSDSDAPSVV